MKSLVSSMVNQIAGKKPELPVAKTVKAKNKAKAPASLRELLDKRQPAKPLAKAVPVKKAAVSAKLVPPGIDVAVKALSNRARVLRYLDQNGSAGFEEIQKAVGLDNRQLENVLYQLAMPTVRKIVRERDREGVASWRLSPIAAVLTARKVPPPSEKRSNPKLAAAKPSVELPIAQEKAAIPPLASILVPALQIKAGARGVASVTGSAVDSGEVPVVIAEILLRAAREIQGLRIDGLKHGQVLVLSVEKV